MAADPLVFTAAAGQRLVAAAGLARALNTSVDYLRQLRAAHSDFPEPVWQAGIAQVWDLDVVDRWAREHGR